MPPVVPVICWVIVVPAVAVEHKYKQATEGTGKNKITLDEWVEELRASGAIGTSGVTRSDLIRDLVMQATRTRREARPKGRAKR